MRIKISVSGNDLRNDVSPKTDFSGIGEPYSESRKRDGMEIFMEKKKENPNILILQDIYKSITLRSDVLTSLLEKTENHELKELLCAAIDTCEGFAGRAEQRLELLSVRAKEPGMLEKIPSEISVKASMLTECCTSKIAELVIEGAVSGVSEYKERIRDADQSGVALENIRLAGDILSFHEEIINKMRPYL
jgi:hypothetical protein